MIFPFTTKTYYRPYPVQPQTNSHPPTPIIFSGMILFSNNMNYNSRNFLLTD